MRQNFLWYGRWYWLHKFKFASKFETLETDVFYLARLSFPFQIQNWNIPLRVLQHVIQHNKTIKTKVKRFWWFTHFCLKYFGTFHKLLWGIAKKKYIFYTYMWCGGLPRYITTNWEGAMVEGKGNLTQITLGAVTWHLQWQRS